MRYLALVFCFMCSCVSESTEVSTNINPKSEVVDSIRLESNAAHVLLHHQVQKISLVAKQIFSRKGIDSLFNYVGPISPDTACIEGGFYNTFGQIDLYADSTRNNKVAELHFLLEGDCAGFYLKAKNYLKRYKLTPEGKVYFNKLCEANKSFFK